MNWASMRHDSSTHADLCLCYWTRAQLLLDILHHGALIHPQASTAKSLSMCFHGTSQRSQYMLEVRMEDEIYMETQTIKPVAAAARIMDSFVFGETDEEKPNVPDSVLQNLLLKSEELSTETPGNEPLAKIVIPEAGFCLKTNTDKGEKVFINICKSEQIPSPKDITDEQLEKLQESGDASQYRVPISLGEPHPVTDNSGSECTAYDVIASFKFLETIHARPKLKTFFLTIVLEGLEDKYKVQFSRDCKIMKNRKFIGHLPEQAVRKKSKPFIVDMDEKKEKNSKLVESKSDLLKDTVSRTPEYTIMREPLEGEIPEFLVMEINLPEINSSKHLCLEVGEDRVVLKTRPNLFYLDIDLPYFLDAEETGSQFNGQSKVLTVTIPVTGLAPT